MSFVLATDDGVDAVAAALEGRTVTDGDEVIVVLPGSDLGERSLGDVPGLRVIPIDHWGDDAFGIGVALARFEQVCAVGPGRGPDVLRRSEILAAAATPISTPPHLHLLTIHLGLRPPERTLYPAIESVRAARFSWPFKYWLVLQQAPRSTVERARALLEGIDHEIVVFADNRGVGVPRALVQDKVGDDELMAILDDDMTIPPGGFDPMYATLLADPDVGAVALHSGGLAYDRLFIEGGRLSRGRVPVVRPYTRVEHTGYGCAMMSARGLRAGGFDPAFVTGGVDLDFSLTLRREGLRVLVYNGHEAQHNHVRTAAYRNERWKKAAIQASHRRIETRWGVQLDKL